MLVMIESGLRVGICQVMPSYVEANNKYINSYDEN